MKSDYKSGFNSGYKTAEQKGYTWAGEYCVAKQNMQDSDTPQDDYWAGYAEGVEQFKQDCGE
jgi:hypothetical protein